MNELDAVRLPRQSFNEQYRAFPEGTWVRIGVPPDGYLGSELRDAHGERGRVAWGITPYSVYGQRRVVYLNIPALGGMYYFDAEYVTPIDRVEIRGGGCPRRSHGAQS